jgi:hypothetical protein
MSHQKAGGYRTLQRRKEDATLSALSSAGLGAFTVSFIHSYYLEFLQKAYH